MISIINFCIKQKFCKHFFVEATKRIAKTRQFQAFIYYLIYSDVRKVFPKRKFDFSCSIDMYPFEHGFIQPFLMSVIQYKKLSLKIEFLNSIFMYIILFVCLFFCVFCLITKLSECFMYAVI